MSILVFAIIVLIVIALVCTAVWQIAIIPPVFRQLIVALLLVLAAVIIAERAGVF